jgi:hypothetical protein
MLVYANISRVHFVPTNRKQSYVKYDFLSIFVLINSETKVPTNNMGKIDHEGNSGTSFLNSKKLDVANQLGNIIFKFQKIRRNQSPTIILI